MILDLAHVEYIDSTGLGSMVICFTSIKKAGGALKLVNLNKRNIELLLLTKLHTIFEVFSDEQDAVNSFFPDREIKHFDILSFVQAASGRMPVECLTAGAKAPVIHARRSGRHRHSLTDPGARPVLLVLYKISCPVCQLTMPYLERIVNGLRSHVIGISQDDERGTERFQMNLRSDMATLLDREEDGYPASNAFGITHVPSLFLVETDAPISLASSGFNKRDLEAIARRAESRIFPPEDNVPEWKAG